MASTLGRRFLLPLLAPRSVLPLHPTRFPFSSVPAFSKEIIQKQNLAAEKFKKAIEQKIGKLPVDTSDILPGYACPFDIKDTPEKSIFILERKYGDETIQVNAKCLSYLDFIVTITTPNDDKPVVYYCHVWPYTEDEEFCIESHGTRVRKLGLPGDQSLRLHNNKETFDYLKERGIDKEFGNFLKAYIAKKCESDYLMIVNKFTNFVEK